MKEVFYLVEVNDNVECQPKIGFYDKEEAEKFLKAKGYSPFDGHNGWKIKKDNESKLIEIYSSVEEYVEYKSYVRARKLAEEETMKEME